MRTLAEDMFARLVSLAQLLSCSVWRYDHNLLVVGAILAPGQWMVSLVLRAVGGARLGASNHIYQRNLS